jgi:hypothetical protein
MRLDEKDRRNLNRRIRNRLSPMIREKLKKAPLMLIITTTIFLSSAAIAQQVAAAENSLQLETQSATLAEDDSVKTYDRDDFNKFDNKMPDELRGLDSKISEQIVSVLKSMGTGDSGTSFLNLGTSQATSDRDYLLQQSALKQQEEKEVDSKDIKNNFAKQGGKSIVNDIAKNSPLFDRLKRGFDFKLNLASIFSSKASETVKTRKGNVHYGLILKDIVPHNDPRNYRAAVGDTPEDSMKYAGHADVVWTIGPMSEQEDSSYSANSSEQGINHPDVVTRVDSSKTDDEFWSNGVPRISTGISGNAKPNAESLGDLASNGGKTPGIIITVTQEQGLYEIMAETAAGDFNERKIEHQLKVPIIGSMSFGRRYDEKMEAIRTSANNILIDKRAPLVSVHYLDKAKQYILDGELVTTDRYKVNFKASTKGNEFSDKNRADEKYEIEWKKDF